MFNTEYETYIGLRTASKMGLMAPLVASREVRSIKIVGLLLIVLWDK